MNNKCEFTICNAHSFTDFKGVEGWQKFEKEKGETEGGEREIEGQNIHRYAVRRE